RHRRARRPVLGHHRRRCARLRVARRLTRMGSILIVNPKASGVSAEVVERVRAVLPADVEVYETAGQGDARARAGEHEPTAHAIYVLSGDGTYNEVVNGITGDVPLGFLPGGGTSVLPRALRLGRDPAAAAPPARAGSRPRRGGTARLERRDAEAWPRPGQRPALRLQRGRRPRRGARS